MYISFFKEKKCEGEGEISSKQKEDQGKVVLVLRATCLCEERGIDLFHKWKVY